MKRIIGLSIPWLLLAQLSLAQEYSHILIPDSLKENADIVTRYSKQVLTISGLEEAEYSSTMAFTILNSRGQSRAELSVFYDEFTMIEDLEATVYDKFGRLRKVVREKDFKDIAAYDGFSIASDSRLKTVDLRMSTYPYTIEFSFHVKYKGTLNIPGWASPGVSRESVVDDNFELKMSPANLARFTTNNLGEPEVFPEGRYTVYSWHVENLKAKPRENDGLSFSSGVSRVIVGMNEFKMDDFAGNMSNWEGLGSWEQKLLDAAGQLSPETRMEVKAIVAGMATRKDSVRALYEYMQGRTRYVSIQLGIGGWQPFAPDFVHEKQYGDCKALSYYMHQLLAAVDIPSHCALIKARSTAQPILASFPSNQFNHMILCVPEVDGDTVWLECTSQTSPFGFLGSFTDDRYALLVMPSGGKLVRTTAYPPEVNTQSIVGDFVISETGDAVGRASLMYTGLEVEHKGLEQVSLQPESDKKNWLSGALRWAGWTQDSVEWNSYLSEVPEIHIQTGITAPGIASSGGTRLFLQANMREAVKVPAANPDRRGKLVVRRGYIYSDTINYRVPEEYRPEYLPSQILESQLFGEFSASYSFENGTVTYVRSLEISPGQYDQQVYEAWRGFWQMVSRSDNDQLVMVNKS